MLDNGQARYPGRHPPGLFEHVEPFGLATIQVNDQQIAGPAGERLETLLVSGEPADQCLSGGNEVSSMARNAGSFSQT